jgi:hypothetical protein
VLLTIQTPLALLLEGWRGLKQLDFRLQNKQHNLNVDDKLASVLKNHLNSQINWRRHLDQETVWLHNIHEKTT